MWKIKKTAATNKKGTVVISFRTHTEKGLLHFNNHVPLPVTQASAFKIPDWVE